MKKTRGNPMNANPMNRTREEREDCFPEPRGEETRP